MVYSISNGAGSSMSIHASFPGMLRREEVAVLPMGYQGVSHWMAVT